jgi:hypothetical protein
MCKVATTDSACNTLAIVFVEILCVPLEEQIDQLNAAIAQGQAPKLATTSWLIVSFGALQRSRGIARYHMGLCPIHFTP